MLLYNEIIQWTSHDKDIHVNRWILKKQSVIRRKYLVEAYFKS